MKRDVFFKTSVPILLIGLVYHPFTMVMCLGAFIAMAVDRIAR